MKKRVYVLIVFISMILFTKPVFLWIDKLTMDTVEANKASYTNQDALLIVLAAIGGSLLLAALPGVIVSIVLRIVKGKPVRNHMETARVRPVKKEKKKRERRKPTWQEVVHRLVAVAGLLLAVYSFWLCTGIEYASLDGNLFYEATEGELAGDIGDAILEAEGLTGKWGFLVKLMVASEQGEEFSLLSFLMPDKIVVIGLLAIIISGVQLFNYNMTKGMNVTAITIAIISIILNYFFAPWIQYFGAAFYFSFGSGFVSSVNGMCDIFVQFIEYLKEIILPWFSEEYRQQKYVDTF